MKKKKASGPACYAGGTGWVATSEISLKMCVSNSSDTEWTHHSTTGDQAPHVSCSSTCWNKAQCDSSQHSLTAWHFCRLCVSDSSHSRANKKPFIRSHCSAEVEHWPDVWNLSVRCSCVRSFNLHHQDSESIVWHQEYVLPCSPPMSAEQGEALMSV